MSGGSPPAAAWRRRRARPGFARLRHQRVAAGSGVALRGLQPQAHLRALVAGRRLSLRRQPRPSRPDGAPAGDLALAYDALQGADPADHACAGRPSSRRRRGSAAASKACASACSAAGPATTPGPRRSARCRWSPRRWRRRPRSCRSARRGRAGRAAAYLITNAESAAFHLDRCAGEPPTRPRDARPLPGRRAPARRLAEPRPARAALVARAGLAAFRAADVLIAPGHAGRGATARRKTWPSAARAWRCARRWGFWRSRSPASACRSRPSRSSSAAKRRWGCRSSRPLARGALPARRRPARGPGRCRGASFRRRWPPEGRHRPSRLSRCAGCRGRPAPKRSVRGGSMPGTRASAARSAGRAAAMRASVAGCRRGLAAAVGAARQRQLRRLQPVEDAALRLAGELAAGGVHGGGRLAGDHREEVRAEALELDRADPGDAGAWRRASPGGGSPSRSACGRGR